ncbi:tail fiber domain-containing protein [Chryseobacterium sp. C39-AII1]|uniref:tail fiber domain-containing protein n=1 Tax=Chryseobacterium sp. C39-AII1 TaxID=3080332 RepID=UPI0032096EAC
MKFKHFYPLLAVFAFSGAYAQVGINTANPQSTLDVVGNVASTSTKDGVTAPRITRQQLAAKVAGTYAAAQSGTLVYVTDFTTPTGTTPSLAQTTNITKVGYYYFDGTVWKQISDTDSPSVNIYNSNGSLTGNRTVTQAANTLAFTSTAVNGFSVDGTTFSVDAANNRIGLGTIAPASKFDVVSDNEGSAAGNDFNFRGFGTSKNPALFLSSAGGTLAAPTNLVTGDLTGTLFFTGRANNTSVNSSISSAYRGDGTTALTDLMFTTSNAERMRIDPTGNVGIGNTAPTVKLDINSGGTSTAPVTAIKIVDGNQAAGKILTSDANGEGTWQIPAVQSSVNIYNTDGTLTDNRIVSQSNRSLAFNGTIANAFSVNRSSSANPILTVDAANDRVGIGTNIPRSRFEIVSDNVGGGAANDFNFTGYGTSKNPGLFFAAASGTAAAPTNLLVNDLIGGIYFTPRANGGFPTGSSVVSGYRGDGTTNLTDLMFTTSGTERVRIDPTGNVGIGNTAPTVKLDINSGGTSGTPIAAVKIVDGNQAAGKILTSDANGEGTWQTPAVQSSVNIYNTNGSLTGNRVVTQGANTLAFTSTATNGFSVDGSTLSVDAANDRVGIGTTTPVAKIDAVGSTFGMRMAAGSWDNLWFDLTANGPSINASGAETGINFNVGTNATGTYGDGQTLTTVATMRPSGNMGIGTTNPEVRLHVVSPTAASGRFNLIDAPQGTGENPILALRNTSTLATSNKAYLGFSNAGPTAGGADWQIGSIRTSATAGGVNQDFYIGNATTGTLNERVRVASNGNVGIGVSVPTEKLHVAGNILASGTVTPSDIRIKKDIVNNVYGLHEVLKLRTINYRYKDENLSKDKKIGFVAQEIKAAMPELVVTANDEMKTLGVNYAEMTVVLTKAVQEQQQIIKNQQTQIDDLKAKVESLLLKK